MPLEKGGPYCHGEENIAEFVTSDIVKQLQSKFKGAQLYSLV